MILAVLLEAGNYTTEEDLLAYSKTHVSQILFRNGGKKRRSRSYLVLGQYVHDSFGISLDRQNLESQLLSRVDGFGDFLLARLT